MKRWIWIILVWLLLPGCAMAGSFTVISTPTMTREPATVTPSAEPSPTFTPTPPEAQPCGYTWANKDLPEVNDQLAQALMAANLAGVEGHASAYGENCVTADGKVQSFHAMQTDFYFTIAVESIEDAGMMGEWVEKIFPLLDQFPPGEVPGPNLGYVGIRYTSSAGVKNLWFRQQAARELLQQGLHQDDLYHALNKP